MAYKDPNDERRIQKDFEYMNSERGYVTRAISNKLKPSYKKYGGHVPEIDKKEFWRLYMNHIIKMKENSEYSANKIFSGLINLYFITIYELIFTNFI